jgi:hypothetical protein
MVERIPIGVFNDGWSARASIESAGLERKEVFLGRGKDDLNGRHLGRGQSRVGPGARREPVG